MQRKLALVGFTLVAIGVALWFALSYGTTGPRVENKAPTPVPREAAADVTAEANGATRVSGADPVAPKSSPSWLRVRSSAGLPLAFVEFESDSSWKRAELVGDACDVSAQALPAKIRAPGHLARAIERAEEELVLEPDALLVIEGAPLRACLVDVGIEEDACARLIDWREARERAVASGWISDAALGIAVASDRLEPLPNRISVVVVRADRMRRYLEFVIRPGLRGTWQMPCEGQLPSGALDVRVERNGGARNRVRLDLLCSAPPGRSGGEVVPWGTVSTSTADLSERLTLAADEDVGHFPVALLGRAHLVGAIDETTHAFGRIAFVHDGRPQVLALREALEIRGRIVEEQTRRPLRRASVFLEGLGSPGWVLDTPNLELDARGEFSLRAPGRAPATESMQLEPPEGWTLSVEQPGFDPRQFLRFDRGGAPILDIGEIALVRHKNPIVLAPGHGLSTNELDGHCVVFADKPEEWWMTVNAVTLEDGRLEVEFASRLDAPATRVDLLRGVKENVTFGRSLGTVLFARIVDDVRTFRLESDGLYHRAPEDSLELTLRTDALPGDGKTWRIGWTWDGAWIGVGQLASEVVGNEKQVRISVPHGAQQLWWSSSGIPPDLHGDPGGFQTISGLSMKVVLR